MTENREKAKDRRTCLHEDCCCPVCTLMRITKEGRNRTGGFLNHFLNAQIEMLQAVKSFVDMGITSLEDHKTCEEDEKKASKSKEE